ncbi:hypothetical protein ACFLQU_01765 [Verrucomicrobiota bacterium]
MFNRDGAAGKVKAKCELPTKKDVIKAIIELILEKLDLPPEAAEPLSDLIEEMEEASEENGGTLEWDIEGNGKFFVNWDNVEFARGCRDCPVPGDKHDVGEISAGYDGVFAADVLPGLKLIGADFAVQYDLLAALWTPAGSSPALNKYLFAVENTVQMGVKFGNAKFLTPKLTTGTSGWPTVEPPSGEGKWIPMVNLSKWVELRERRVCNPTDAARSDKD